MAVYGEENCRVLFKSINIATAAGHCNLQLNVPELVLGLNPVFAHLFTLCVFGFWCKCNWAALYSTTSISSSFQNVVTHDVLMSGV